MRRVLTVIIVTVTGTWPLYITQSQHDRGDARGARYIGGPSNAPERAARFYGAEFKLRTVCVSLLRTKKLKSTHSRMLTVHTCGFISC